MTEQLKALKVKPKTHTRIAVWCAKKQMTIDEGVMNLLALARKYPNEL